MSSGFTKATRLKLWLFRILDLLVLWVPAIVYIIIAWQNGEVTTTRKIVLSGLVAVALIIVLVNFIFQKHKRSPIRLVFIGLYICIDKLLIPLILMLAVASILDDFLFQPLINYYKTTLIASKTYDKRQKLDEIEAISKE